MESTICPLVKNHTSKFISLSFSKIQFIINVSSQITPIIITFYLKIIYQLIHKRYISLKNIIIKSIDCYINVKKKLMMSIYKNVEYGIMRIKINKINKKLFFE